MPCACRVPWEQHYFWPTLGQRYITPWASSCFDLPGAAPLRPAQPALRAPHWASLGLSFLHFLLPPLSLALFPLFLSCSFLLQHFGPLPFAWGWGCKDEQGRVPAGAGDKLQHRNPLETVTPRERGGRRAQRGPGVAVEASPQPPGFPQPSHLCNEPPDTSCSLGPRTK